MRELIVQVSIISPSKRSWLGRPLSRMPDARRNPRGFDSRNGEESRSGPEAVARSSGDMAAEQNEDAKQHI